MSRDLTAVNATTRRSHMVNFETVRRTTSGGQVAGRRFGGENIRVVGSITGGEADRDSGFDLSADAIRTAMFPLAGFALAAEDRLQVFTRITAVKGLIARIRDRPPAEAAPLWKARAGAARPEA